MIRDMPQLVNAAPGATRLSDQRAQCRAVFFGGARDDLRRQRRRGRGLVPSGNAFEVIAHELLVVGRWIAAHDTHAKIIDNLRSDAQERALFLVVGHFGGGDPRENYRVGVPRRGRWKEVLNSNSEYYGGTGLGNGGGRMAEEVPADGLSHSLSLTLPPATTFIFKWTQE